MANDTLLPEIKENRKPNYPIHPLILNRWSPRSMTGESITEAELFSLFEAARWAPSSSNAQPWHFLYANRETIYWNSLFNLLVDFNKQWCSQAAVLGIIFSRKNFEKTNKPSVTHAFDTGAAWQNLCLQGTYQGLVVHGMEGFNYSKAQELVSSDYQVLAMFAVGKRGKVKDLPKDLQEREVPSQRKEIHEFAFEGEMKKSSAL